MNILQTILLLGVITVCSVHSRSIEPFDLKGFLQRVIKTNLEAKNPWKIGEIKIGCDEYEWCSYYKKHCSHPTVETYCKGTCGKCAPKTTTTPKPDCNDKMSCQRLKSYCTHEGYSKTIQELCPKTCGLCGEQLTCGIAKRRSNTKANPIVGGSEPEKGFYPWQVSIYYAGSFLCGGSLIDDKRVLTAAHCFKELSTDTSLYEIKLGDHNRAADEGTEETRKVVQITQHQEYQHESDTHDVALLVMDKYVVFGNDINAICLPTDNQVLPVGSKCFMSGWGRIHNAGTSVDRLQHVALPIAERDHCVQRNRFNGHIVNDRMICAGYNDGMNYASGCHGDSGGPLACQQPNGSWMLFGVTSWGSPQCNGLDRYTVFSRVSKYTSWIRQQSNL